MFKIWITAFTDGQATLVMVSVISSDDLYSILMPVGPSRKTNFCN